MGKGDRPDRFAHSGNVRLGHQRFQYMLVVAMHLGGLAWDAAPRPPSNILLQAIPSETFHDEANGGFGAWMDEAT